MTETTAVTVTSQTGLELVNPKLRSQYDVLTAEIRSRLSPDHAFIFSRPERSLDADSSKISWFADGVGEPYPLHSLHPDQQAAIKAKLEKIEADLHALADRLKTEGTASAELGRLIEDALVRQPTNTTWVLDGKPVLVNWGFRSADQERTRERPMVLVAEGVPVRPAAPAASAAQADAQQGVTQATRIAVAANSRRSSSLKTLAAALLWGLFCALLLVSGYRLLQACTFASATWPAFIQGWLPKNCNVPVADADAGLLAQIATFQSSMQQAETSLLIKAATCRAACIAPPQPASIPAPAAPPMRPPTIDPSGVILHRGELELDLSWNTHADLDLSVSCPGGDINDYQTENKNKCGALFDHDANRAGTPPYTNSPIEHILWNSPDTARPGTYSAIVNFFDVTDDGRSSVPYKVVLRRRFQCDGQEREVELISKSGLAKFSQKRQPQTIFTFELPLPPPPCSP